MVNIKQDDKNNYYYLQIEFEGYGVRVKAPNLESIEHTSRGYQQLVRCFVDLLQLMDTNVLDIFNKYQIEVFFE